MVNNTNGAIEFSVTVRLNISELATWQPYQISALFGGIAGLMVARGDLPTTLENPATNSQVTADSGPPATPEKDAETTTVKTSKAAAPTPVKSDDEKMTVCKTASAPKRLTIGIAKREVTTYGALVEAINTLPEPFTLDEARAYVLEHHPQLKGPKFANNSNSCWTQMKEMKFTELRGQLRNDKPLCKRIAAAGSSTKYETQPQQRDREAMPINPRRLSVDDTTPTLASSI